MHVEAIHVDLADRFVATELGLSERLRAEHLHVAEHLRGEGLVHVDDGHVPELRARGVERGGGGVQWAP